MAYSKPDSGCFKFVIFSTYSTINLFDFNRCLNHERVQRYEPAKLGKIILACCILHNILIRNNVPFDASGIEVEPFEIDLSVPQEGAAAVRVDAENIRRQLANSTY